MLAGWRKWLLLIGMALGASAAALYFRPDPPPPPSPVQIGSTAVALELRREGDHLRVVWDRRNPEIRKASQAALHITDGKYQSTLPLDAGDLAIGSALYWPESDRYSFRLDLGNGSGDTVNETAAVEEIPAPAAVKPAPRKVQRPPVPVIPAARKFAEDPPEHKVGKESRVSRAIGHVPLLRRLRKHRPAIDPY
jgi:hypothetical protein